MNAGRTGISILAQDQGRARALEAALVGQGIDVLPPAWSAKAEAVLLAVPETGAEAALGQARTLLDEGRARAVILCGPSGPAGMGPDPALLLAAMRAGIGEYLSEPLNPAELEAALQRLRQRSRGVDAQPGRPEQGGRVILVLGAKGGVGATTVAVNLAHALCQHAPTALLDLAAPQGETPIFLDLEHAYTWADVAANIERLDATYLESVMARHSSGLAVLPAPDFGGGAALDPGALRQVLGLMRQVYAQVVVDAGTGQDEAALEALEMADDVLLVLDLSLPCLARAKRFLEAVRAARPHLEGRVRLVANRTTSQSDIGAAQAEDILRMKISWRILNDYQAALSAINEGRPLAEADPRCPLARAYAAMGRELARGLGRLVEGGQTGAQAGGRAGALWARLKSVAPVLNLGRHSA